MKNTLIVISLLFIWTSVFAKNKVYTVGVESIFFLPYSKVENKKYMGVFKEILDEFAKKNNIEFRYIPLPIARLYTNFFNEKLDFKFPSNPGWQSASKKKRGLEIKYSLPVLDYIDGVFVKSSFEIGELKKLGVVTGFTTFEYNDLINSGKIERSDNPNIGGLVKQLMLGRIDAAYLNIAVGRHYLKTSSGKIDVIRFAKNLPFTKSHYHLATIKHPELIKQFNKFLKEEKSFMDNIKSAIKLD